MAKRIKTDGSTELMLAGREEIRLPHTAFSFDPETGEEFLNKEGRNILFPKARGQGHPFIPKGYSGYKFLT
ncbi:MAG: hypothetical protein Q8P52_00910 [bacterium]|nr:hypothetical protein [bacterium]